MTETDFVALNKQCVSNLYLCLDNVVKYLDNGMNEEIKKLQKCLEGYCLLEAQHNLANEALDTAKKETDSSNIDNLQDRFTQHLNRLTGRRQNLGNHPYMVEFKKKVAKKTMELRNNLDDSDLAITQSQDQFIDPITKKPIQNPVKNVTCGHVYEKESIYEFIHRKQPTRCPVAGCGNKTPITKQQLITDEELKFRLTINHHSTLAENHTLSHDISIE